MPIRQRTKPAGRATSIVILTSRTSLRIWRVTHTRIHTHAYTQTRRHRQTHRRARRRSHEHTRRTYTHTHEFHETPPHNVSPKSLNRTRNRLHAGPRASTGGGWCQWDTRREGPLLSRRQRSTVHALHSHDNSHAQNQNQEIVCR